MLITEACLSGLLVGSEVEFGVEPGNRKSYSEDIKNQSQFDLITSASISHCFPKNRVREDTKKWVEKNGKKRWRRENLQNSFTL